MRSHSLRSRLRHVCSRLGELDRNLAQGIGRRITPRQRAFWLIGVSLLFAALMLASSWILRDSEHGQTLVFFLIAVWWVPYSLLATAISHASDVNGDKKCDSEGS